MGQLINFEKYQPEQEQHLDTMANPNVKERTPVNIDEGKLMLTLNILKERFPRKLLFTISETAEICNVGDEFIRRRIKSGKINSVSMGDKPMINIVDLAIITTGGIENGS